MNSSPSMRFGLRLIQFLGGPRELVGMAVRAEAAGFDSVWFPHDTFMHNTWVLATAAAEATSRVQIGGVGVSPYHANPCEIATSLATLDELSGGRALLGLGFHTQEFVAWTGIESTDYLNHTREAAEIIRGLFRGEVVAYQGESFRWDEQCYFRFPPLRERVPIYICPFGEDYLELSGAIGDGSLPMITPPASASEMIARIHRGANAAGRPLEDVAVSGCAWLSVSSSHQAAADKMRDMVAYFGHHLEDHALATIGLQPADFEPIRTRVEARDYEGAHDLVSDPMLQLGIVGTPADVVREIELLAEAGITEVNLGGPLGPDIFAAIDLLGREVIPHFR